MGCSQKYVQSSMDYRASHLVKPWKEGAAYECAVEATDDDQVGLTFGETHFAIRTVDALELRDCLRDAFNVVLFGYEDPWGERDLSVNLFTRYRPCGEIYHYVAEGEVEASRLSGNLLKDSGMDAATIQIKLRTIADGGYEFSFDSANYSFDLDTAVGLCYALQNACTHIEMLEKQALSAA